MNEKHRCSLCGITEKCKEGACDFRTTYGAHGYCIAKLSDPERVKFYEGFP